MSDEGKTVLFNFLQLMFASFLLFLLSILMGTVTADLLKYMNDPHIAKPWNEWALFWTLAPIASAMWCALWVWFKKAEKICVDAATRTKVRTPKN